MSNNTQSRDWTPVLNSVKTPLGFFTLLALILDGLLMAVATRVEEVTIWAPIGLLGLLLISVFIIVLRDPKALYHPDDWPKELIDNKDLIVNLVFPVEPHKVQLNTDECVLEVRTKDRRTKYKGPPTIRFGHGGWSVKLTEDIEPSDTIYLELIEDDGREWRVNPIAPYETEAKVLETSRPA